MAIDPNNLQGTAHVTFNDDFNALNLWSPSNPNGTWATTFWYQDPNGNGATLAGNGEQEWYINSNYGPTSGIKPWAASNGVLTLTAAPAGGASGLINGYAYTSGEINTYHSFSQTYGYFEMKAQLPAGQGFWPAFWLLPENGAWPPELDVMEVLGNDPTRLYNTVHTNQTGSHTMAGDGGVQVADMSAGYHTYGVDWEPDAITFYFDGQKVYSTPTPSDMHGPMYMIANLADGGYWPGGANGQTGQMHIDYIRAYAAGPDSSASSPAPVSAPPPAASAPQPQPASGGGQTFTSDNNGDHWTGASANDLFNLGRGGDVVTGGGGADTFKFAEVPWAGGHITDFGADDRLDLSAMFAHYGYAGADPLHDGHLQFVSDGQGGAQVVFDMDGLSSGSGSWVVTTLDHVAASGLSIANGVITEGASSAAAAASPSSSGLAASTTGQTFTSDNGGDHWTGTAGADTFNVGRGGDVLTGNGGNDTFVFHETPWASGHITDFQSGDTLDLSGMLARDGYVSGDAVAQGFLKVDASASGDAQIWSHLGGQWWEATTLDHVSAASLHVNGAFITG
jgi:beta-glucanase (GH16 family)